MTVEKVCLTEKRWAQVTFLRDLLHLDWSSSVQFQIIHVFLDPGVTGVSTDLSAPFGLEYHSWLGTEAAGLKVIHHKVSRELSQGIREAAGGGRV